MRDYWDNEADRFDNEPDHGLVDPTVREAWTNLLANWLPPLPASILDIGCGTGSLSILLATLGFDVIGVDLSEAMIARAKEKASAAGRSISFRVMDAFNPDMSMPQFDIIVCRHVLWALPDPGLALRRWIKMLASNGRLLLIEGYWHTGAGLPSLQVLEALPSSFTNVVVQNLSDQPALWGGEVTDERYIIIADHYAEG